MKRKMKRKTCCIMSIALGLALMGGVLSVALPGSSFGVSAAAGPWSVEENVKLPEVQKVEKSNRQNSKPTTPWGYTAYIMDYVEKDGVVEMQKIDDRNYVHFKSTATGTDAEGAEIKFKNTYSGNFETEFYALSKYTYAGLTDCWSGYFYNPSLQAKLDVENIFADISVMSVVFTDAQDTQKSFSVEITCSSNYLNSTPTAHVKTLNDKVSRWYDRTDGTYNSTCYGDWDGQGYRFDMHGNSLSNVTHNASQPLLPFKVGFDPSTYEVYAYIYSTSTGGGEPVRRVIADLDDAADMGAEDLADYAGSFQNGYNVSFTIDDMQRNDRSVAAEGLDYRPIEDRWDRYADIYIQNVNGEALTKADFFIEEETEARRSTDIRLSLKEGLISRVDLSGNDVFAISASDVIVDTEGLAADTITWEVYDPQWRKSTAADLNEEGIWTIIYRAENTEQGKFNDIARQIVVADGALPVANDEFVGWTIEDSVHLPYVQQVYNGGRKTGTDPSPWGTNVPILDYSYDADGDILTRRFDDRTYTYLRSSRSGDAAEGLAFMLKDSYTGNFETDFYVVSPFSFAGMYETWNGDFYDLSTQENRYYAENVYNSVTEMEIVFTDKNDPAKSFTVVLRGSANYQLSTVNINVESDIMSLRSRVYGRTSGEFERIAYGNVDGQGYRFDAHGYSFSNVTEGDPSRPMLPIRIGFDPSTMDVYAWVYKTRTSTEVEKRVVLNLATDSDGAFSSGDFADGFNVSFALRDMVDDGQQILDAWDEYRPIADGWERRADIYFYGINGEAVTSADFADLFEYEQNENISMTFADGVEAESVVDIAGAEVDLPVGTDVTVDPGTDAAVRNLKITVYNPAGEEATENLFAAAGEWRIVYRAETTLGEYNELVRKIRIIDSRIKHSLIFDMGNHGSLSPQEVVLGELPERPEEPSAEGYTFGGWYEDSEFKREYTFEKIISDDTTIYAKWIANTYTIVFRSNGHGTSPASVTAAYDSVLERPADLSAPGYIFLGWYTDEAGTQEYDFNSLVKGGFTLYAKWIKAYTVSFSGNGYGNIPAEAKVAEGGKVEKPEDPTAEGFVFGGWYMDAECTTVYDFNSPVNENLTLYAKWTEENTGSGCGSFVSGAGAISVLAVISGISIWLKKSRKEDE